jgi:bacillithiol system protein YtxJ
MAKNRLERSWNPINKNIPVYYLDLISFRQLSNEVANRFDLVHESPQLLLIQKGELKVHASHSAISAELIEEL